MNDSANIDLSASQVEELLHKILDSGKPLTITVNGTQTIYNGIDEAKSINIDFQTPLTEHNEDPYAHGNIMAKMDDIYNHDGYSLFMCKAEDD